MLFFSRWPGTATAHTSKFVGIQLKKKTFERRRCIPNMRFVRDGAYSSAYWLIWRLRRPRFHDMPQISCSTWCKVEREVNLKMAEGIKVGGESSWCQGDCKPNRTRTVTAILESAMNMEEEEEERLY